ncbi:RDS/peripherin-like protein xRDS35 [Salvelinus sp. IW2-2015]|uniref:RDS/peripherin-like protein xRDS35 n=1 Tax=Salvelinus sp. IW2-2015 TaxID=2691554 RepID=UPI0038D4D701
MDGVPFSCCNPGSPRPCLQNHLTDNAAHYNYEHQSEELNLYIRGCRQALVDYYMGLMNTIGPGILSVISLQMSVLVSLRYLQTSLDGVDPENPEADSEGYILAKGVKETMMDVKNTMFNLLQFGQVEAGDEAEAGDDGEKAATSS